MDGIVDKIKSVWESSKSAVIYVITPIFFIAGMLYYFVVRYWEMKTEIKSKEGNEKLKELQGEQTQIDHSANNAVANFEKLRADYLRGSDSGGGASGPGPKDPS